MARLLQAHNAAAALAIELEGFERVSYTSGTTQGAAAVAGAAGFEPPLPPLTRLERNELEQLVLQAAAMRFASHRPRVIA